MFFRSKFRVFLFYSSGVEVVARMEVLKVESRRIGHVLVCSTVCRLPDGQIAVEGEARVLLPHVKSIDAKSDP